MKSGNGVSVIERLKQEMSAQEEGQDDVLEFVFEDIEVRNFTPEIAKLFGKYSKLISLEFSNCNIESLNGFPNLPNLVKLSLESNKLKDDCVDYIVSHFKDLQFLSLSENQIKSLDSLKKFSQLQKLVQLDLQDNPVSQNDDYRGTLFSICKNLEILDNKDKDGKEVEYSDDEEDEDENEEDDEQEFDNLGDDDDEEELEDDEDEDLEDDEDEPAAKKKKRV